MEVSLDNFRHNYRVVREYVKPSRIIAVIKADAYGMGAVPVAWALKAEGADFFGVATPDEAIELREAGNGDPVLVLGSSPYCAAETYVKLGIRPAITDTRMAEELSKAAVRQNRQAHVHIKVDSGMGRIGFLPHELPSAAEKISKLPGINIEGTFTHFATADTGHGSLLQLRRLACQPVRHVLRRGAPRSYPERPYPLRGVRRRNPLQTVFRVQNRRRIGTGAAPWFWNQLRPNVHHK